MQIICSRANVLPKCNEEGINRNKKRNKQTPSDSTEPKQAAQQERGMGIVWVSVWYGYSDPAQSIPFSSSFSAQPQQTRQSNNRLR
jgi:hypothetical protein